MKYNTAPTKAPISPPYIINAIMSLSYHSLSGLVNSIRPCIKIIPILKLTYDFSQCTMLYVQKPLRRLAHVSTYTTLGDVGKTHSLLSGFFCGTNRILNPESQQKSGCRSENGGDMPFSAQKCALIHIFSTLS